MHFYQFFLFVLDTQTLFCDMNKRFEKNENIIWFWKT